MRRVTPSTMLSLITLQMRNRHNPIPAPVVFRTQGVRRKVRKQAIVVVEGAVGAFVAPAVGVDAAVGIALGTTAIVVAGAWPASTASDDTTIDSSQTYASSTSPRAQRTRPISWQAARLTWVQRAESLWVTPTPGSYSCSWRSLSFVLSSDSWRIFSLSLCKTCKTFPLVVDSCTGPTTNLGVESRG